MSEELDITFMRLALVEARAAAACGEVPVGAVVVRNGKVIGSGANAPISSRDPTAHAEIVALRAAAAFADNYRLPGATLYCTVEPCLMCAGALVHARIERLVYAAPEPKSGAVHSTAAVLDNQDLNHRVSVTAGVLSDEAAQMMSRFFRERRASRVATATSESTAAPSDK